MWLCLTSIGLAAQTRVAVKLRVQLGHADAVNSVAFSPDGRYVLTGSQDGSTRLWDTQSAKHLATLVSFRQGGWAVVDPEGR